MSEEEATLEISGDGKRGFMLRSPLMPAAGFLGYGRTFSRILNPRLFGALVTRPTTLRPHSGGHRPRFARVRSGFIMPLPPPNPGIGAVLREYAPSWRRWRVPVVVAVFAATAEEAAALASRLEQEETVAGVELQVPQGASEAWLAEMLRALSMGTELPTLVKLPLSQATELADTAVVSGAAALVLGTPHYGTAPHDRISGPVYGPAVLSYTLQALQEIVGATSLPLIASGGIYSTSDVEACLNSGAIACQLDGLIFLDPSGAAELVRPFAPA